MPLLRVNHRSNQPIKGNDENASGSSVRCSVVIPVLRCQSSDRSADEKRLHKLSQTVDGITPRTVKLHWKRDTITHRKGAIPATVPKLLFS